MFPSFLGIKFIVDFSSKTFLLCSSFKESKRIVSYLMLIVTSKECWNLFGRHNRTKNIILIVTLLLVVFKIKPKVWYTCWLKSTATSINYWSTAMFANSSSIKGFQKIPARWLSNWLISSIKSTIDRRRNRCKKKRI